MEEPSLSHLFEWQAGSLTHCTAVLVYLLLPADKLLEGRDYILCFHRERWSLRYTLLQTHSNVKNICFQKLNPTLDDKTSY